MSNHPTRRVLLASPALLLAQTPPSDQMRVAVIGVGNRGSYLLKSLLEIPGAKVVAICDINPESAEKAKAAVAAASGDAAVYADFRKMLDQRKDIDAVVIATPVDTHKMISVAALEVGRNVYCEKPMAHTADDARQMARAAKSAKGVFQIGFQLRHDPKRAASMAFVKSGGLGRIVYLQGYRHGGDLPHQTAWLFDKKRSGDIVVEQACHIIDLMVWAAGAPPLRCMGSGGITLFKDDPPGRTVMDNYSLIYEFPGDLRLNFSQHYFDPPGFSGIKERVYGEKGAIDLATATWSARDKRGANTLDVPNSDKGPEFHALSAFLGDARGKKLPLNNADSGLQSTLVAIMGRKAIEERRIVEWKEMT